MPVAKTILITGAGTGIGKDAACRLAARGHHVIATTETDTQAAALSTDAERCGVPLEVFTLNIERAEDGSKVLGMHIDVLINNAGIGETGPLAEVPMERVRQNFETNLFAPLELTQLVIPDMLTRRTGTVIFVSSLAGRAPMPFLNPYSMTKFALSGGIAAMRKEIHAVAPGVHVSLIEPGAYATGFNQRMFAKKYEWLGPDSHFYDLIPTLQKNEKRFARLEQRSTARIAQCIVRAAEAASPRTRYSAPWYQGFGVYLLRLFGA